MEGGRGGLFGGGLLISAAHCLDLWAEVREG